ncbi:nucleotidyl transferase AbiEii/AbiGii toxin family protein [Neorhizobium petrolearium]|uniref:Nucleotidyl transferase AbiEii/AbiGii toxin family protein n=1 Tax=Neorhizobium petrolearium TaxID=515361 RepID=A0ABY8M5Y8_9HYPH|nr:nucleotidyl transferase AbiEii/AbiGii toxin family protein [Neorhizobium petrolearium]MCC2608915.1 nucleotidyl transferase AbiEii/AbiGii toxin family protein [Neorhizobium petrolearium]WGI69161.1 nucleotidyl transferase AbiEii/AbiGii toxin family protein [Neorhizobium petrolearium]
MKTFLNHEHRVIAEALSLMDHDYLLANRCWFGGGTAIVLKLGEYRRSLDVDFLCSSIQGYRELRSAAAERGLRAFFPEPVKALRDFRIDQYGVRTMLEFKGQQIRFEIVREGRVDLDGVRDADLGVPILSTADMVTEKLLANADRCQDRSVAYRDAFDLGMLMERHGPFPAQAVDKARMAYGTDIQRKLAWVVDRLQDDGERDMAADVLTMQRDIASRAISFLRDEVARLWPLPTDSES